LAGGWRELAGITRQRLTLAFVMRRDVDDERRRRRIVNEAVADPLDAPRRLARLVPAKPAREGGGAKHLACRAVIGMAIVPVRNGNRPRTMSANAIDRRADRLRRPHDATVGPTEVLTPCDAEHARRRVGLDAPLLGRSVG